MFAATLDPTMPDPALDLEAVEAAIQVALESNWAVKGLLELSAVVVAEMVAAGFEAGLDEPVSDVIADDEGRERRVWSSVFDPEGAHWLWICTRIQVALAPEKLAQATLRCTVFRPVALDSKQAWKQAALVWTDFETTQPLSLAATPDWFFDAVVRSSNPLLDQEVLTHLQALSRVTDPELARSSAAMLARRLLAKLSP